MRHIERHELNWQRAAEAPAALILLPTWCGCTLVHMDARGRLFGIRDVNGKPGEPYYDRCLTAWIEGERELGRVIDDRRLTEPTPAGPQHVLAGAGSDAGASFARKRAAEPLRAAKPQAACDVGLFAQRGQHDMFG